MALVPFRVSGPAADQHAEERLFQIGGHTLRIKQIPQASNALRTGAAAAGGGVAHDTRVEWPQDDDQDDQEPHGGGSKPGLQNVGFVVWQVGFVVADLLMRHPPWGRGDWAGVHAVDLGTGTGLVGIALAMSGAVVVLTDMAHILPLAEANVAANCAGGLALRSPRAARCQWGCREDAEAVVRVAGQRPDLITAADVLYEPHHHANLLSTLRALSAPHTLSYVGYKRRNADEERFVPLAEAAGFSVEVVPLAHLSEEYRDGTYQVLRMCLLDAEMALD